MILLKCLRFATSKNMLKRMKKNICDLPVYQNKSLIWFQGMEVPNFFKNEIFLKLKS
jgi:hypothetical protein